MTICNLHEEIKLILETRMLNGIDGFNFKVKWNPAIFREVLLQFFIVINLKINWAIFSSERFQPIERIPMVPLMLNQMILVEKFIHNSHRETTRISSTINL